ncbi:MAG: diguanylate cyclase [Lachnospiraceae bacterium]
MDVTAQLLFEYIKDILYSPLQARLEPKSLPEGFQKLGMGMVQLGEWLQEAQDFSKSLARGELSKEAPDGENVIAAPMKELQGSLRHLTWQVQQIAKGDYSQKVDFMGDFSEAFNTMTEQLSQRTESLLEEKKRVEAISRETELAFNLMLALINNMQNMIFVISGDAKESLFRNHSAKCFQELYPMAAEEMGRKLLLHAPKQEGESAKCELYIMPDGGEEKLYYEVESFHISWNGTPSIVYIVTDETQQKKKENLIHDMAYTDPLTGLKNRRYATERMESLAAEGKPFLLSLIDVDYLKYCNDTYGHDKGDEYLKNVSNMLSNMHCEVCRIGGDEFYLIKEGKDMEEHDRQLAHLREFLIAQRHCPYPQSFSYATSIVADGRDGLLQQHLRETDKKMYEYKKKHKKPLQDWNYRDSRIR